MYFSPSLSQNFPSLSRKFPSLSQISPSLSRNFPSLSQISPSLSLLCSLNLRHTVPPHVWEVWEVWVVFRFPYYIYNTKARCYLITDPTPAPPLWEGNCYAYHRAATEPSAGSQSIGGQPIHRRQQIHRWAANPLPCRGGAGVGSVSISVRRHLPLQWLHLPVSLVQSSQSPPQPRRCSSTPARCETGRP